ncbi:hypothetical protein WMY93_007572 [Mugilogobius chulae]|uniref:MADF domain-containing protein n=1 Tax=Mugilogobius chulae TaxID=88201 RepID=A0AAW0PGF9_9GOBI
MAKLRSGRWTLAKEELLVEKWQLHECLYNVSCKTYHNRVEKEKAWAEIAAELECSVTDVKTRATSLRTQYSKLLKPKPSVVVEMLLTYIKAKVAAHKPGFSEKTCDAACPETTLDLADNVQEDEVLEEAEPIPETCCPPSDHQRRKKKEFFGVHSAVVGSARLEGPHSSKSFSSPE